MKRNPKHRPPWPYTNRDAPWYWAMVPAAVYPLAEFLSILWTGRSVLL